MIADIYAIEGKFWLTDDEILVAYFTKTFVY
jgi:hypothetical protein